MRVFFLATVLATFSSTAWADITSNLLAWYKFDEGSGTTSADSSGNGKTGTLENGATWTSGKVNKAVLLDGTNDHVLLPTALGIDNIGAMTIGAWFKPTSLGDFEMLLSHYASDAQRCEFCLSGSGSGGSNDLQSILCTGSTPTEGYDTRNRVAVGSWIHCCMVFDGGQTGNENRLKLYVNGVYVRFVEEVQQEVGYVGSGIFATVLVPTFRGTIPATTTNNGGTATYIGSRSGASFRLHGAVDECRIYSRALAAADVSELCNHKLQMITAVYPSGGLPDYRIVKINGSTNEFELCGASDLNAIGCTRAAVGSVRELTILRSSYAIRLDSSGLRPMSEYVSLDGQHAVTLEAAVGAAITSGAVVYQAADGKISHTGTVRVGVASRLYQSESLELWLVISL